MMDLAVFLVLAFAFTQVIARNVPNEVHSITGRNVEALQRVELERSPYFLEVNKDILHELKEGDIQESPDTWNTIVDSYTNLFWPNKTIPVSFSNNTSLMTRAAVDEARREFELRTCLTFPDWTDQNNYLDIQRLGGCFSSVGMQRGRQIVSIGVGCEEMYTVVHEFMHAMGIWHEQSRADRDDYVQIHYEVVSAGLENNFNNYGFDETDDRRVSYDFDSVMHYFKTAFSSDGNVTIETRDPAFADVIGQQSGFSEGDATKIARMYDCSDTVRITNSVNFEEDNVGGYSQEGLNGEVKWMKHILETSDTTGPTTKYLPKFDSTFGLDGKGNFMYLDTSVRISGMAGAIKSMRYKTNVAHQCLEYSYYIKLNTGSQAFLEVYVASVDIVSGEITSYGQPVKTHRLNTGDLQVWWVQRMTISAPSSYRIVFWAKTDGYYSDVIAIDDVSVVDKICDTSYFQVPGYTEMMTSYAVDQYYQSQVMYTGTPGYAFEILVYPAGTQEAIDAGRPDRMGLYFRLVGGAYDEELEWPFDRRFLRLVVTDQLPNPVKRMNYYDNILTRSNPTNFRAFQKPIGLGSPNEAVGWSAFMRNKQMFTRMHIKHDVVYFSVEITDMTPYEDEHGIVTRAQMRNPVLRRYDDKSLQLQDSREYGLSEVNPENPESSEYDEDSQKGMITVEMATLIILISSGVVMVIMAITICMVAKSYAKTHTGAINNIKSVPSTSGKSGIRETWYSEEFQ